jgi:hypothetical protein
VIFAWLILNLKIGEKRHKCLGFETWLFENFYFEIRKYKTANKNRAK